MTTPMNSFQNLLTMNVVNDYYTDLVNADLVWHPTQATAQLMKNYKLLLRSTPSGILVLCNCIDKEADPSQFEVLGSLPLGFNLVFWAELKQPYFGNFSDVSLEVTEAVYQYNNLGQLPDGDPVELPANKKTILRPRVFQYTFIEPVNDPLVEVINPYGESVISAQLTGTTYCYTINLSLDPEGAYSLQVNGEVVFDFFSVDLQLKDTPFAVLQLANKNADTDAYQLVADDHTLMTKNYAVHYERRSTTWQYIVVNQSDKITLENPAILDENGNKVFSGPVAVVLPNGQQGLAFASDTSLELMEVSPYQFQLMNNYRGFGENDPPLYPPVPLVNPLPAPSVKNLRPAPEDENSFFSEIYIYL